MNTRFMILVLAATSIALLATAAPTAGLVTRPDAGASTPSTASPVLQPNLQATVKETLDTLTGPLTGKAPAPVAPCLLPLGYSGPAVHVRGGCSV